MNRSLRLVILASAAAGATVWNATDASAFAPVDQTHLEIPIPTYPTGVYQTSQTVQASLDAATSVEGAYGGDWMVQSWNPQTNTPHRILGSGANVAGSLVADFDAADAALSVATQNSQALGLDPSSLELLKVTRGLGKVAAHFQQVWNGYEVMGGRYHATFLESGRLFVMGSDFYSNITLDPNPTVSLAEAEFAATKDLGFDPSVDSIVGEPVLKVLPFATGVDQVRHHLVYEFRIEIQEPYAIWQTYVDAHAGEIVWRYDDVHYFSGTTEADVEQDTYCNGETPGPVGYMEVSVSGQGTTNSDVDGNWSIGAGSGSATVTSRFYGPYCDVNRSSGGSDASFTGTADGGTPFTIDWTDANSRQDERDVFEGVSDVHDFISTFDPTFGYINQRMTARVGVSGTCNAFWNGTINFYNAGGGCANSGEIQGVVHHEFGHGVQNAIIGGQGNEGLGEGNSDILANFITDESIIGRGFQLNCSAGIRNSDNTLQYPEDLTGQVHNDGRIMAGAVWDVREALEASLGQEAGEFRAAQLWHFGRILEQPTNQPDQALSMFIADDDDGDLINGTPNFDAICTGIGQHGFECPLVVIGVFIQHTPPASPHPEGTVDLVADVTSTVTGANIIPGSVVVDYWVNGVGPSQVQMTNTNGATYTASFAIDANEEVAYQISAEDDQGYAGTSPLDAPATLHYVDAPTVFDDMEAAGGWSVNSEGSDDASTGIWVRVNPNGTEAQPEDDHTPNPGVNAWVTGQGTVGGAVGENDVDGGTTTLYSPVYDASGGEFAIVKYWRWYSNDKGNAPNADEWVVQVRNDGGPWIDLERNQDNQNQWFQIRADLVSIFGTPGNIQFKFLASDLATGSIVEAGLDDFSVVIGTTQDPADAPSIGADVARYALLGARPNPIAGQGRIAFQVPTRTDVNVEVFDVSGRSLRVLANGAFEAGTHSVEWDGKDDRGHSVGSGVYYVQMVTGEYTATRKITVQK